MSKNMAKPIYLYNTLTRRKEEFEPLHAPAVGMYVCGPTVYGDPHLGHVRPAVTFDLLFRLLRYEGYKVRYVRNITDVGHLENDADSGEDKIAKKARLEQLEPMEIAQHYTNRYHEFMDRLGVLRPSIEPHASGHIIEQKALIQKLRQKWKNYAYEVNGSIYFDVRKYVEDGHNYGILSGRNLDDMQSGGRSEDFETEKRFSADFALWKKASPEHIMRWPYQLKGSKYGFPGWHLECSAMAQKYLGKKFDIHGGGMDLMFPHHECEIAQSVAAYGDIPAKYWVHNNMVTIGGQKMGKSLGNFITLEQFFTGDHALLSQAYAPMVIRFFILQAHYRSTLDFSDEALQAAEKGLERLTKAWNLLTSGRLTPAATSTIPSPSALLGECEDALCDDLNSPVAIAKLFDWVRHVNALNDGTLSATAEDIQTLKDTFDRILGDLLGLTPQTDAASGSDRLGGVVDMVLEVRQQAKAAKDWATSDLIRDRLAALGIRVKDRKDGADWELE